MKELNHYLKRLNYILNKIFKILFFLLLVYVIMNKNRGVVYMENNNENQNVSDINLEEVTKNVGVFLRHFYPFLYAR